MKKTLFWAFLFLAGAASAQVPYDTVTVRDPQNFTEMTVIDPGNGQIISRKNNLNRRINLDTLRKWITPDVLQAWIGDPLDSVDVNSAYWDQFVTDSLGRVWYVDSDGDAKMLKDTTIVGIADGDKGDITVSGSGATWNIDSGVVGATEIASTAVTPGSYTRSSITVDADGRITAASSGASDADGNGIIDSLPNGSIVIDPNNYDLQIGTPAANNTGEFEFYALNAEGNDVGIYAGSADSSSIAGIFPAEAGIFTDDGNVLLNYDYAGDIFNVAMFGDSMFTGAYPGADLTYVIDDLPRDPQDTISGVLVQDWSTKRVYVRDASTLESGSSARDTFDILLSGQSNAWGASGPNAIDTTANANVFIWNHAKASPGWQVARINQRPFRCSGYNSVDGGGTRNDLNGSNNHVFQFAKRLADEENKVVRIVMAIGDGRAITYWHNSSTTQQYYDSITVRSVAAGVDNYDLVVWDQGESDRTTAAATYKLRLDSVITNLRSESYIENATPIILVGMPHPAYGAGWDRDKRDPELQSYDFGSDPWIAYAETDNLVIANDSVHYDGTSLRTIGRERIWEAWKSLPKSFRARNNASNLVTKYYSDGTQTIDFADKSAGVWSVDLTSAISHELIFSNPADYSSAKYSIHFKNASSDRLHFPSNVLLADSTAMGTRVLLASTIWDCYWDGSNYWANDTLGSAFEITDSLFLIDGLWAYYRADSVNQLDGTDVTQWNDISGNARHAKSTTLADNRPPSFDADAGDGIPAVLFNRGTSSDDNGEFLATDTLSWTSDSLTVFLLVKNEGTAGIAEAPVIIGDSGDPATYAAWTVLFFTNEKMYLQSHNGTSFNQTFTDNNMRTTSWRLYSLVWNGGGYDIYLNGVLQGDDDGVYSNIQSVFGGNLTIGANYKRSLSQSVSEFGGGVGLLAIYAKALNETNRNSVENYINRIFNIW